ncbi:MAG: hypothetical protein V4649_14380 [Bacteroidota bacterium]
MEQGTIAAAVAPFSLPAGLRKIFKATTFAREQAKQTGVGGRKKGAVKAFFKSAFRKKSK